MGPDRAELEGRPRRRLTWVGRASCGVCVIGRRGVGRRGVGRRCRAVVGWVAVAGPLKIGQWSILLRLGSSIGHCLTFGSGRGSSTIDHWSIFPCPPSTIDHWPISRVHRRGSPTSPRPGRGDPSAHVVVSLRAAGDPRPPAVHFPPVQPAQPSDDCPIPRVRVKIWGLTGTAGQSIPSGGLAFRR